MEHFIHTPHSFLRLETCRKNVLVQSGPVLATSRTAIDEFLSSGEHQSNDAEKPEHFVLDLLTDDLILQVRVR